MIVEYAARVEAGTTKSSCFPTSMDVQKPEHTLQAPQMDLSPQPHVFVDPDRIEAELQREFALSARELLDVATRIYQGFIRVSGLHPKGFNGTNAWAEGTAHLRATLIPKGWAVDDPLGQPRIIAPGRKLSITVSSGNADTGVPHRVPQTRNDKGSQTASSVQFNARQGVLFPVPTAEHTPATKDSGQALWVLLYYIDLDAGHMRMELSRPTAMSDADKINGWSVRYILPPISLLPNVQDQGPDELPDIDFDVVPKQS